MPIISLMRPTIPDVQLMRNVLGLQGTAQGHVATQEWVFVSNRQHNLQPAQVI